MFFPLNHLNNIFLKFKKDHISAFSGQSAYFALLSVLPFLMFLLTLIQHLNIKTDAVLEVLNFIIPKIYQPYLQGILYDIQQTTSATILSISLIIAIWTAAKGIHAVSSGLNVIYEVDDAHNYLILRLHSMFYTFFLALIIIITMLLLIFGKNIFDNLLDSPLYVPKVIYLIVDFRPLIAFLIFFIICTLFYTFLPSKHQRLRFQIAGAIFTSLSWLLGSYLFSLYLDVSRSKRYLYGSLSYLILFLIYLYVLIYLFFVGAEINRYMTNTRIRKKTG